MAGETSRLKRFVAVAREGTNEGRRELLREIADAFRADRDSFSESQLNHFVDVLTGAAENGDEATRTVIAQELAEAPAAPHDLVAILAEDDFAIAEPILRRSAVLDEDDLMRIARRQGHDHRRAIAARADLTSAVTSELVGRGDRDVLLTLIENDNAEISADTMMRIVGRTRTLAELHAPLLQRDSLGPAALTRIYFLVSSALKREILERADAIDPAIAAEAVRMNRRCLLASPNARGEGECAYQFLRSRTDRSTVTETLLNELIEQDRFSEFQLAFSYYAGVDAAAGDEILRDHSWESMAIACRATGLERSTFASIASALLEGGEDHNKAVRMLDIYLRVPQEAADRIMRFWRVEGARGKAEINEAATPSADATLGRAAG